jgi:hypothetical protein
LFDQIVIDELKADQARTTRRAAVAQPVMFGKFRVVPIEEMRALDRAARLRAKASSDDLYRAVYAYHRASEAQVVFVPEIGLPDLARPPRGYRQCDLLVYRDRRLIGHEIKLRRQDWLNELRRPEKSAPWFQVCQEWWVVAPSVKVVRPEELPVGWGLLIPDKSGELAVEVVPSMPTKATRAGPILGDSNSHPWPHRPTG